MKQKTSAKFLRLYKDFSEVYCWERAEKSAKHLLASIAFKENSKKYIESTESVLLSSIGYYYSIFHMSMALCWLNPEIEDSELIRIKHSTLQNLIKNKFVNQSLLERSFTDLIMNLKEEREWMNYTFGEFNYDFFENASENEKLLNSNFDSCIKLMDEICELLINHFDIKQRIKTYVADSKGNDLLQTYFSYQQQENIMNEIFRLGYSN